MDSDEDADALEIGLVLVVKLRRCGAGVHMSAVGVALVASPSSYPDGAVIAKVDDGITCLLPIRTSSSLSFAFSIISALLSSLFPLTKRIAAWRGDSSLP